MKKVVILASSLALLQGCGEQTSLQGSSAIDTSANKRAPSVDQSTQKSPVIRKSNINKFMASGKVCDLLSRQQLIELFNISSELTIQPSMTKQRGFTCQYFWSESNKQSRAKANNRQMTIRIDNTHKTVNNFLSVQASSHDRIDGVGDAAFWSREGTPGLSVLDGDVSLFIAPLIAADEKSNIEYAKKVYAAIVR